MDQGNAVFPPSPYESEFIERILRRIYHEGQIPTREENLFLLTLKSHPSAVALAIGLLRPGSDVYVQQFAANLLTQIFESSGPEIYTEEVVNGLVTVISANSRAYGHEGPATTKIRRQLMTALGLAFRPLLNWKSKFTDLVHSIQPDFFQSASPSPVALDCFYVFVKFGKRKYGGGAGAFHLVVEYFDDLLRRNFSAFGESQLVYIKFLGEWLRDVEDFDTPTAEVGKLMVQVAKFVDCRERQNLPWSAVQVEAATTLEVFLGLTDLHLLQKSLIELLNVILAFPVHFRAQTTPIEQAPLYLNTTVNVFLHFTLEFADVVIACTDSEETRQLLPVFIERLQLLADPFPEKTSVTPHEETFSRNAITAFSELSSLLFQMCGIGSDVACSVLPQLKAFFQVFLKKSQPPRKEIMSSWSHEEQEHYRDMRHDVKKAVENLALAVGNHVYTWIGEEFLAVFQTNGSMQRLSGICWVFRFAYSCRAASSDAFRAILGHLQKVFNCQDRDCIFQAFKALEAWLPALLDCGFEESLTVFVPVISGALAQKDASLTNMSVGSLAALIETLSRHILPSYMLLSETIAENLMGAVGSLTSRATLTKSLGHLIAKLPPNQAASELDNRVFPVFTAMLSKSRTPTDLVAVIGLLPGFFRAVGSDTVEIQLSVNAVIYQAVTQLGSRLLGHLHDTGILDLKDSATKQLDGVCSSLIKEILYASGPAVKELLPAVVPVVGQFFTRNPVAPVLDLITELLTVHLDGAGFEGLFSQLCIYVFTSVISLSERENWTEYWDIYASFSLTAYPVIRSSASTLVRLDMNWEGLLKLVMKLLILLPFSGDSDSTVQSNLIFEELLRMKPKDIKLLDGFVNPIKTLLQNGYGIKLVQQFLTIFYDSSSDEQRVRMCSDCLFVMLAEIGVDTKLWLKQVPSPVTETDSIQHMAYDRLLSTIIAQRSKSALARHIKTYRHKFRNVALDEGTR